MNYPIFEEFISQSGGQYIKRTNAEDSFTFIPVDEANSDYQQYLLDTDGGLPLP